MDEKTDESGKVTDTAVPAVGVESLYVCADPGKAGAAMARIAYPNARICYRTRSGE